MQLKIYKDKQEVAEGFCTYLIDVLATKEVLHIALSGGSTPKIIFDTLASTYSHQIDWTKVHLYWGDERCVPPTDDDSNYKMTHTHLLSKISIPEPNIHRIQGEVVPEEEAINYGKVLLENVPLAKEIPQFDLVLLGMGDDGHTASIFPHEIKLWESDKFCEVAVHPDSGQRRITITGQIINNAKSIVFLVTGESKAEKVSEIIEKKGAYTTYPATLVAPKSEDLLWFLDAPAAEQIV